MVGCWARRVSGAGLEMGLDLDTFSCLICISSDNNCLLRYFLNQSTPPNALNISAWSGVIRRLRFIFDPVSSDLGLGMVYSQYLIIM